MEKPISIDLISTQKPEEPKTLGPVYQVFTDNARLLTQTFGSPIRQ